MRQHILRQIEQDEEKNHGNLLLINIKKHPLKHGALSETAAKVLGALEIELEVDTWVDDQFDQVYDALNDVKTDKNIHFVYSKLSSLANLLKNSISPGHTSTQCKSKKKVIHYTVQNLLEKGK